MKKYYMPNRMHIIPAPASPWLPYGCEQIICVFTSKRKMFKYYGKDVEYKVVEPKKKEGEL